MSYYYLVSSLPNISLDAKPPLNLEEFCSSCADHLSECDTNALNCVLDIDGAPTDHPFVKMWMARETQLRNAAARLRAAKQNRDAVDFLREHTGFDVGIENCVEEAFNHSNPLERERALDKTRWTALDELAGTDPFSINAVLAYAVKLTLAERWATMDQDQGQTKIEAAIFNKQDNQTDKNSKEINK